MLIAAAVAGSGPNTYIAELFEESEQLWIIETDENKAVAVYNRRDDDGSFFAKQCYLHDCEAIVCGKLQQAVFEQIASKSISRYLGAGLEPFEAAKAAELNYLPLITDHIGGTGCGSHEVDRCAEDMAKEEE